MRQKLSGAFTVLEMLVVIAIIAILIAMLYPAVSGMQERGKTTQDMNNLRQIGIATQMYLNDNDGGFFLPTGGTTWMQALHPKYLGSWKVFQSPFDKRTPLENDTSAPISYGFNTHAQGTSGETLLSDKITNPSMFVLFAPAQDGSTTSKFNGTAGGAVTVDKNGGGSQGTAAGGTHNRRQRVDACMADLHVENMSWTTYKNGQASPPSDPCGQQRWDPIATCP
jgi:prepilin-type N-terminal cleavage/methylation domain-containing protein